METEAVYICAGVVTLIFVAAWLILHFVNKTGLHEELDGKNKLWKNDKGRR